MPLGHVHELAHILLARGHRNFLNTPQFLWIRINSILIQHMTEPIYARAQKLALLTGQPQVILVKPIQQLLQHIQMRSPCLRCCQTVINIELNKNPEQFLTDNLRHPRLEDLTRQLNTKRHDQKLPLAAIRASKTEDIL
jgi:hypothetical protein